MAFKCPECEFIADNKSQLLQHQRSANQWRSFNCEVCGARFRRKANLDRHMVKHKDDNNVHCQPCGRAFSRPDALERHLREKHQIRGWTKRRHNEIDSNQTTKRLCKADDPKLFYTISKVKDQWIPKIRTTASVYKVKFKDIEVTDDVLSALKILFSFLFDEMTKGSKSDDLVMMTIQSPSLGYPIVIPMDKLSTLTTDRFMAELERVLQSNEEFVLDESLIFEVTLCDMPEGGTVKLCKYLNTEKFLKDKKCIIRIQNKDELCCARAIITTKAQ